jgi:hypothetical protein
VYNVEFHVDLQPTVPVLGWVNLSISSIFIFIFYLSQFELVHTFTVFLTVFLFLVYIWKITYFFGIGLLLVLQKKIELLYNYYRTSSEIVGIRKNIHDSRYSGTLFSFFTIMEGADSMRFFFKEEIKKIEMTFNDTWFISVPVCSRYGV